MRPLGFDFFWEATESLASYTACIKISSTGLPIESLIRSAIWRSTSALTRSRRGSWSSIMTQSGQALPCWLPESVAWCCGSGFLNAAVQVSIVTALVTDGSVAVYYDRCGLQLSSCSGSSTWETRSKGWEPVTGLSLHISKFVIGSALKCLHDIWAVLEQENIVTQWLHINERLFSIRSLQSTRQWTHTKLDCLERIENLKKHSSLKSETDFTFK